MKIACPCGAKFEFELRPDMREHPVQFVCPACGLDASRFVDALVRQELGQTSTPTGTPVPALGPANLAPPAGILLTSENEPVGSDSPVRPTQTQSAPSLSQAAPACPKHPGEITTAKCRVCGKPICPKCMELFGYVCSPLCRARAGSHGIEIPVYQGQRSVIEARRWRKIAWSGATAAAFLALCLGFWFWYAWFGCLPKPVFSVRFAEPAYSGQSTLAGPERHQLVFLHGGTLARYDLVTKKQVWSRDLLDPAQIRKAVELEQKENQALIDRANNEGWDQVPKMPTLEELTSQMEREAAAELALYVRGQNVWVASAEKLVRYDWSSGKPAKEIAVEPGQGGLLYRGDELLLVDTRNAKATVTHINLLSGDQREERLTTDSTEGTNQIRLETPADLTAGAGTQPLAGLPKGAGGNSSSGPMDPSRVAEQAQRLSLPEKYALPALLAANMNQQRALNEMNDSAPRPQAAAPSAPTGAGLTLVPTKDGFVEVSVRLLEARMVARSAMKPATGKSALEGTVTAGKSMELSNELLNEMQRSNGGDIVREDHSRYQVTLRSPATSSSWTGEVIGPPKLYPLDSVNVLAAEKIIYVFNKKNQKLWQSALGYNVMDGLAALDEESATYGQGPCVERKGMLYVFDAGVLSAFDLATGNARWRLPSVGIAGLFFDDQDMIYVNSTTASHESLKYSRQIDLSQRVRSIILKLDSRNGKILWSTESRGLVNYVSGKFILAAQSSIPDTPDDADADVEKRPWMRIRRISASDGREVWDHFQERAPLDIGFDPNTIRLVFKREVQVLHYPNF